METELILLIAPADVAAFRRLARLKLLAASKPATRLLRNTHFDTPELHLKEHGMELRVRRAGGVEIQTLKAVGQAAEAGLALDQGELRQGDTHEPISEIELELKAGTPEGRPRSSSRDRNRRACC